TKGYGVYEFHATNSGLWIGSDTDRISDFQFKGRLALMPVTGGASLPTEFTGTLPNKVVSLGLTRSGSGTQQDRTASRTFSTAGSTSSESVAAGTSQWRNLRGAFMVDGKLYTGWSDGTFKVQDYNGTTFGPQSDVPLQLVPGVSNSRNRFATQDLANVTGLFFDPATGRMYFSNSDSTRLHHRGFSTESRIV